MQKIRRTMVYAIAATATVIAIPAAAHYLWRPGATDPLGQTLRDYGFLPIKPASNLMRVGSLYYVDAEVKDFKAICHPSKSDLDGVVMTSRSWELQESLDREGRFATDVKIDFGWVFGGSNDTSYTQRVHYSLTDVTLEEIPLGASFLIFAKLMERPECNKMAMQYIRAGGYVCQGQKLLHATAEFKLDADAQNKISTSGKANARDIKDIVKLAVEAQGNQSVVERDGRLLAGAALNYGVSMNPTCLAPDPSRYQRVLPRSAWDRFTNFMLFNVIEPILPVKAGGDETVERSQSTRG
jgi:hypothetical protein